MKFWKGEYPVIERVSSFREDTPYYVIGKDGEPEMAVLDKNYFME